MCMGKWTYPQSEEQLLHCFLTLLVFQMDTLLVDFSTKILHEFVFPELYIWHGAPSISDSLL